MDENYLDNLLNEISLDNEIDEDMERLKQEGQASFKENAFDQVMSQDANTRLSSGDDILGESAFDELDELDRMADMDMSDLDFADLDFDDLDMLETTPNQENQIRHASPTDSENFANADASEINIDDLAIDDMFFEQPAQNAQETYNTTPTPDMASVSEQSDMTDGLANMEADAFDAADASQSDAFSADTYEANNMDSMDENDLNDLFEMLGIEDDTQGTNTETTANAEQVSQPAFTEDNEPAGFSENLNNIYDESVSQPDVVSEKKPRRSFLQFLFGPDDDEDEEPSEEELAAIKAEKQAKKEEKKAEKQAIKDEKQAEKQARDAAANADKAAKKALKAAKKKEEEAALPPEKGLNKTAVAVIMVFFAIVASVIILGTNTFNYSLVIHKATDYFSRQKYHMAYDEIAGVEIKEKDKELKNKIYTVMYVERLYESYEIDMKLGRTNKALDSLLRGLKKYDEHYAEAQELNIVQDINYSRDKIVSALLSTYGLTVDDAYAILALDSYAYRATLEQYVWEQGDEPIILDGANDITTEAGTEVPIAPETQEPTDAVDTEGDGGPQ